jgi:copper chaperone CopZ
MQHVTDCHVDPVASRAGPEELQRARYVDLAVAGMGCPNCGNRIRNALMARAGVLEVAVDVWRALVRVWYAPDDVGVEEIVSVVRIAGESTHHRYMAVPVGSRWRTRSRAGGKRRPTA